MAVILYTALFSSLLRPPLCCTAVSCTTSATEMRIYLYMSPAIKSYLQKGSLIHEEKRSSPAYDFSIFITVCLFTVFSLEQCTTKCWSLANASMSKYLLQSKIFFHSCRFLYLRAGRKYLGSEGRVHLYQICPDFLSSSKVPK